MAGDDPKILSYTSRVSEIRQHNKVRPTQAAAAKQALVAVSRLDAALDAIRPTDAEVQVGSALCIAWNDLIGSVVRATTRADRLIEAVNPIQAPSDVTANGKGRRCTVEGCNTPHYAKGLCNGHYQRAYDGRRPPKTKGGRPSNPNGALDSAGFSW